MEFEITFEREEDGRWIAEIESLPGVLAYKRNLPVLRTGQRRHPILQFSPVQAKATFKARGGGTSVSLSTSDYRRATIEHLNVCDASGNVTGTAPYLSRVRRSRLPAP